MAPTLLVTGGAGYIGSHTCVQLLEEGHDVVVLDNLENSCAEALDRVREITGKELTFYQDDMLDPAALETIFRTHSFDAVLHFAGLKAVGESTEVPLRYYHNNVTGTLHLLDTMKRHGVRDIVFSSSATVYGDPASVPITEDFPLVATNPYGRTKLMIEEILRDLCAADLIKPHFLRIDFGLGPFPILHRILGGQTDDVMILDIDKGRVTVDHRNPKVVVKS